MKPLLLSIIFCLFSIPLIAQWAVPFANGDVESSTPMAQSGINWVIEGMYISVNAANSNKFDNANSGLAAGEGVDGSQALKVVVQNTANDASNGFHVNLVSNRIDISNFGNGNYTFSFYSKSTTAPAGRPFWLVVNAYDQSNANVTSATLTKVDNGGTVTFSGMESAYVQQTVSVTIADHSSGGSNAAYLELVAQSARYDNTYYFDNFSLTGPAGVGNSVTFNVDDGTNPIENASISFNGQSYLTNATGSVIISGLQSLTYDYSITATGFEPFSGQVVVNGADEIVSATLTPVPTYNITFNVQDNANAAILGASVTIDGNSYTDDDSNGSLTVPGFSAGSYEYTVNALGYETFTATATVVDQDVTETVTLTASPRYEVTFRATDGSTLLAGATVSFEGSDYTTDASGVATVTGLLSGSYPFSASLSGYESASGTVTVNDQNTDVYIVLDPIMTPSYRPLVPMINGDIEDQTAMTANADMTRWDISGMWLFMNTANVNKFDADNSGLVMGEGVNGSQALRSTIVNATGGTADVTLNAEVDISTNGIGDYTFTFYSRASNVIESRPFWLAVSAFDAVNNNVSSTTLTKLDNGGTVAWEGMQHGYIKQSVTVTVAKNSETEGSDAVKLRLALQHAAFDNTYFFDNFSLLGPVPQSDAVFTVTDGTTTGPISGAVVSINGSDFTTDAAGVATATNLLPGTYPYSVAASGYDGSTGEITVTNSDISEAVAMAPFTPKDFTFRVTDGTTTLANATVNVDGMAYTTNAVGTAVAVGLNEGTYAFSASAAGYGTATGSITVGKSNEDIYVVLEPITAPDFRPEIALANGNLESTTAMTGNTSGTRYDVEGFYINVQAQNLFKFDVANSGLAAIAGANGSQALKMTTTQTQTDPASFHVTLNSGDVDISGYGTGRYTFSFYVRSDNAPSVSPFFLVASSVDATGNVVSSETISDYERLPNWESMGNGYMKQTLSFTVSENTAGGANATKLRLNIQSALADNTYYFDRFELLGPVPQSDATFTVTDITTSDPISGATVNVNGSGYTTDANGIATATGLLPGNYAYSVAASGYDGSTGEITVTNSDISEAVAMAPFTPKDFTFRVTDGTTTLANATVNVDGMAYTTNAVGTAVAVGLNEGTYAFSASAAGYSTANGSITVGTSNEDIYVVLDPVTDPDYRPNIALLNGNMESAVPMTANVSGTRYDVDGMYITASNTSFFNSAQSGLAPVKGVNGTQALKSTIQNTTGSSAAVSLNLAETDISAYGTGTYTFTFYTRATSAVENRPFWVVVSALDADNNVVTDATLTKVDNGGTVIWEGIESGYLKQSVSVIIGENTTGGGNAAKLRLNVQHAAFNNTYFFDNFSLIGPLPKSNAVFTVTDESSVAISGAVININGSDFTTDASGVATVNDLAPGTYLYSVIASGYNGSTGEITVTDGDVTETVVMSAFTPKDFTFHVTDGTNLLAGAVVNLNGADYITDATGTVTAGSLEEGTFGLTVTLDGYKTVTSSLTVGASNEDIYVVMEPSNAISFRPEVPLLNGDVESNTPMTGNASGSRYDLEGMYISVSDVTMFNSSESGLAAVGGVNGTQALKSTIQNTDGSSARVSLNVGDADISAFGYGEYTFTFYTRASNAVTNRPFWVNAVALDAEGNNVSEGTLAKIDNGGTVIWEGIESGYLKQSVSVTIAENTTGGANAAKLRLNLQHAAFNNTYWFDGFELRGPALDTYEATFLISDGIKALENATLTILGANFSSNEDGQITIPEIAPGIYDYSVSLFGYDDYQGTLTVTNQDISVDVMMTLTPSYFVFFNISSDSRSVRNAIVSFNGLEYTTNSVGKVTIANVYAGTYEYTVAGEGYIPFSGSVTVVSEDVTENVELEGDGVTSLPEIDSNSIRVYPNPATGFLKISSLTDKITSLEIFSVLGIRHFSQQINTHEFLIELEDYPTGTYLLKLRNGEGKQFIQRFIIK